MGQGLTPGLRLGLYAFGLGMLLGPVRELLLAPAMGGVSAALAEVALLLPALWLLARQVLRPPPARPWVTGLAAIAVVVALDLGLGALFALLAPALERVPRSLGEQALGLVPLAWLGLLPWLLRPSR